MSFQQGLSGLNSSSRQLDTIGNNVANASTVGFKQSQAQFSDQYAVSLSGGGGAQIGMGSKVAAIAQQFTQGNITQTSNVMDTAISGGGFFRMLEASGGVLFSRNGQFQVDKNGFIVNNQGHQLTGYLPNSAGVIVPSQALPIQISAADLLPNPSVNVTVGLNLDARASVPTNVASFSTIDPDSYNNSTSLTVYDSLGVNHVGSLYFQRQPITTLGTGEFLAAGAEMTLTSTSGLAIGNTITLAGVPYTITAVTSATTVDVTPPSAGVVLPVAATTNAGAPEWNVYLTVDGVSVPLATAPMATLTFNLLGQLTSPVGPPVGLAVSDFFTPSGASAQQLTFNFGQTSQYGGNFGVNTLTQDGFTSGRLTGFSTGSDGIILGRYSNGQSRALGQVLLANFTNPQGLQPMGNNEWAETSEAGAPLIGTPGSSSLGLLQSSAVEDSNVDLTAELVSMITAQRVYQANAQTIKTQDQVLQTLVNLR